MTDFTWTFPQFIVSPVSSTLPNVVTAINWVCTGTNGLVTSSNSGTVQLGSPNPAKFIPYDEITPELAFLWVSQSISVPGIEANIAMQLNELSQQPVQPQKPPF
jgi:hypothetical protein